METIKLEGLSSVVDLSGVERTKRADLWTGAATTIFPGLSIKTMDTDPTIGLIQHSRMGQGALFAIDSAPAEVSYMPRGAADSTQFITMMLQAGGATIAHQRQRQCELTHGDICFIDECHPFRLVGAENSQLLLLRMPRSLVISRFPEMEHLVATLIPGRDPGTQLLSHTLMQLLIVARDLREAQQQAALNAIVHLLGATSGLAVELENMHWRVQKALDFIELNLSIPGLTAEQVAQAQHISRRRLDQLMREALGLSITGQIWSRRLQRAADDLRDSRWASASISQVAFANGFEDPAHFARAFKRRFETTPGQWRARARTLTH
jgi:AraC-like DNA-binding protein